MSHKPPTQIVTRTIAVKMQGHMQTRPAEGSSKAQPGLWWISMVNEALGIFGCLQTYNLDAIGVTGRVSATGIFAVASV